MTNPTALSRKQTGYRMPAGEWFNTIIDRINSLVAGTLTGSWTGTFTGTVNPSGLGQVAIQSAAAAGSNSQANATPITKSQVIVVTVTATTRAVRLPTAATGNKVQINNSATTAVKVYPATNDKIGSGATNAVGAAIAAQKGNIYVAKDAVTWQVLTGA